MARARTRCLAAALSQRPPARQRGVHGLCRAHLQKLSVFFTDLNTKGPVLVEAGTNGSWPKGVEIKMLKRSIQSVYSYYVDKQLYVYAVISEDDPSDVKKLRWDEYVINWGPLLTVSITDLLPPMCATTPVTNQEFAMGVNRPIVLMFTVET